MMELRQRQLRTDHYYVNSSDTDNLGNRPTDVYGAGTCYDVTNFDSDNLGKQSSTLFLELVRP